MNTPDTAPTDKTGFDKFVDEQMVSPSFAKAYAKARRRLSPAPHDALTNPRNRHERRAALAVTYKQMRAANTRRAEYAAKKQTRAYKRAAREVAAMRSRFAAFGAYLTGGES